MAKIIIASLFFLALIVCGSAQEPYRRVHLALKQNNMDQFEKIFLDLSNPDSPNYAKWLSIEQIAKIIGVTKTDLITITSWLNSIGARNTKLMPSKDLLITEIPQNYADFIVQRKSDYHRIVRAEELSQITKTQLHLNYINNVEKLIEIAWDMPMDESDSTNVVQPKLHSDAGSLFSRKVKVPRPLQSYGDPNSQKQSYGMPTDLVGQNNLTQMVWGTGTFGFTKSDLSYFYSEFSIPTNTKFLIRSGYAGTPGGDNFGEGTLDTTMISSMAPGVRTIVSNTNNSQSTEWGLGFGYALLDFATTLSTTQDIPSVLSMSLGSLSWDSCNILCTSVAKRGRYSMSDCVAYMNKQRQVCMYDSADQVNRINNEFMKLGARGMTLLAATGDGGSHFSFGAFGGSFPTGIASELNDISCALNFPTFPAASPYVVGVGGTDWTNGVSNPVAWAASGGGFSWRFAMPSWQKNAVLSYLNNYSSSSGFPPQNAYNATNRAYPDVAALANNVPMVIGGSTQLVGGTSASTPTFAGMITMINDQRKSKNLPTLGFVNPRLYQIAAQHPGEAFYDVTDGNSNCGSDGYCCNTGFPATPGWDVTTGLGSPLWPGLLQYLGSD